MSENRKRRLLFVACTLLGLFLAACGGGGGGDTGGGTPLPPKILSWSAPTAYTDNTVLNPLTELDSFEVYVNQTGVFSYADTPVAYVQAVAPGSGQVTTEFNLANLGPYLSLGVPYHVSLRAVALTGARSDFSPAASFSF